MSDRGSGKMFYCWWIVAATFVIVFFGTGIAFYSFSVFIKPLEAHFGWGRTEISLAVALWALLYGLSGPFVGVFIDKYGARAVITFCALLAGVTNLVLGSLNSLLMLFVLLFFNGIGAAGITLIPNQTLISNWFEKYRGRAMGIMMAGIGLGGLTMPPVSNALITAFGWRTSFRVGGILLILAIVPLAALVLRTRPSDMGLDPDGTEGDGGGEQAPGGQAENEPVGLSVKRAVGTRSFWMLFVAFVLQTFGVAAGRSWPVACLIHQETIDLQCSSLRSPLSQPGSRSHSYSPINTRTSSPKPDIGRQKFRLKQTSAFCQRSWD